MLLLMCAAQGRTRACVAQRSRPPLEGPPPLRWAWGLEMRRLGELGSRVGHQVQPLLHMLGVRHQFLHQALLPHLLVARWWRRQGRNAPGSAQLP